MRERTFEAEVPGPFDLDLTVRSHGFYDLAPWSYVPERRTLARPLRLRSGRAVEVEANRREGGVALAIRVVSDGEIGVAEAREACAQLRTCLALDDDLRPFHDRVRQLEEAAAARPGARRTLPSLGWAVERGAGRMLRSPTVFEDAVKTLCTTNCTWALTRVMVRNLVATLGEPSPLGGRTFPTAEAMAGRPERFFRETIRAGYRAGALRSIAQAVASGALDMEAWRRPHHATDALAASIRELPGFGPYATEHLLRLLGRHDHLALDSWTRAKLVRLRQPRRTPSDVSIRKWYAPYGAWAGLAMWLEVTADWHGPAPTWPVPADGRAGRDLP